MTGNDNKVGGNGASLGNSPSEIVAQAAISGVSVVSVFFIVFLGSPRPITFAALALSMAATAYLLSLARRGLPAGFPLPVIAFLVFPAAIAVSSWQGAPEPGDPGGSATGHGESNVRGELALAMLEADMAMVGRDRDTAVATMRRVLERIDAEVPADLILRSVAVNRILGSRNPDDDPKPYLTLIEEHVDKLADAPSITPGIKVEWMDRAGRLAGDLGQLKRSLEHFRGAVKAIESEEEPDPGRLAIMRLNIAITLDRLGRKDAAKTLLDKAVPEMEAGLPHNHPARVQAAKMLVALKGAPVEPRDARGGTTESREGREAP